MRIDICTGDIVRCDFGILILILDDRLGSRTGKQGRKEVVMKENQLFLSARHQSLLKCKEIIGGVKI